MRNVVTRDGLECRADGVAFVIPLAAAGRVVECDLAPLPHARPPIRGIAVVGGGEVLLCAGVTASTAGPATRATRAVVLEIGDGLRWALEIEQVIGITRVDDRGTAQVSGAPPWLLESTTSTGRSVAWVDVGALVSELAAPRARATAA